MKRIDIYVYKYCGVIIVTASVLYYLSLEHLLKNGYSSSSVLVYRGLLTFSITVLLSFKNKERILPRNIHRQALRIFVSGIGLLLSFQSLKYVEATTASMVARLDIPFAVIIGVLTGTQKKDFKIGLSIFAFCMVLSIFFFAGDIGEGVLGLTLCILSVMLVSVSYMLIKKSTGEENNFVIVNTTNIGCIAVGLISGIAFGNLSMIKVSDLWIFAIASVSQFLLNYTMSIIYRHRDLAQGQRPYLTGVLVLLIIEQVWHWRVFDLHHSGIIILVIAVIYLITLDKWPFKSNWLLKKA